MRGTDSTVDTQNVTGSAEAQKEDADAAEDADEAETTGENIETTESTTTNGGITEDQKAQLFASIKEAVTTGYLEPNGIAPLDFSWSEAGGENSNSWHYLMNIFVNYNMTNALYDTTDFHYTMPSDSMQQLMNSVLDGIVNWLNEPANSSVNFFDLDRTISPVWEVIPANVTFTE